jgi:enamine deaminase RidA (YjgF/YER057c/UK114 family)
MAGRIEGRLAELGIELPKAGKPVANFVPCVQSGTTLYISGQIPSLNGEVRHVGKVGREITLDEAKAAARLCGLNAIAQARAFLGDLDKVTRVCMVQGLVNGMPDFTEHPIVMNGASDLFVEVFGDTVGRHARFAVGAGSLPYNVAVEVAVIMEVAP